MKNDVIGKTLAGIVVATCTAILLAGPAHAVKPKRVEAAASPQVLQPTTPLERMTPPPVQMMDQRYCRGDLTMQPQQVTLTFGQQALTLNQGQRAVKEIPEDSPLIRPGGKVAATVSYRVTNHSTKTFKVRIPVWQRSQSIASEEVRFSPSQTKTITQSVLLEASGTQQYLSFNVMEPPDECGIDDAWAALFHAELWVRIFAV
jgi:hypothetical protein